MNKKWGGDEILLIFQKGIKRENETEDSLCFHFEKDENCKTIVFFPFIIIKNCEKLIKKL